MRRVDIDFDRPSDQPWLSSERLIERMLSTFSFLLPPGERFFIASVREHAHLISDPVLKEEVRRFIYQEAMHCRGHDAANSMLKRHYRRGALLERLADREVALLGRLIGRSGRLAGTCATEHFTATAARTLLQYQNIIEPVMAPPFYSLWMWHAVEESEHKSVCFDVYRTCVGTGFFSYFVRILIYLLTTGVFLMTLVVGMIMLGPPPRPLQPADGVPKPPPPRPESSSPLERRIRRLGPLLVLILPWRQYFAYFRPSFHPSDYDCTDDIERWKKRFPDFDGSARKPRPTAESSPSETHATGA